jgi:hypothetical protein
MTRKARILNGLLGLAVFVLLVTPAVAQSNTGKLQVEVKPNQAYLFVDGKAIRDGSQTIALSPGKHIIGVYNYGYMPKTQTVDIVAGQTLNLNVALQKAGATVAGSFADIQLEGHPRAAVLLNGSTPNYFVGHVDEFDNNLIWHQWLLVKPGTYQVTARQDGKTIWSGSVAVNAGQQVIIDLNHGGKITTKRFPEGFKLGPQPRFDAGIASAMVPIAPVTASLAASPVNTACGESAALEWKTTDAADVSLTPLGDVSGSGSRNVTPTRTTTYRLVAKGPGGEIQQNATVTVDTQPTATLALSQAQLQYHKIGDKIVQQDAAMLSWSAPHAASVQILPFGVVAQKGERRIEALPARTNPGPVDRDLTYTMNVANACGGTLTKTATLHVIGSIDPAPSVTLVSIFYPTNYPQKNRPLVGLVRSQEQALNKVATTFQNNQEYDSQGKLVVVGHADMRDSDAYNLALSQRRADLVKQYLVSDGVPADKIEVRAEGKQQQLTQKRVQVLQAQNVQAPPQWMAKQARATWLAYNRRVDINLQPAGQTSTTLYPNDAPEARLLWQRPEPHLAVVESASHLLQHNMLAQKR